MYTTMDAARREKFGCFFFLSYNVCKTRHRSEECRGHGKQACSAHQQSAQSGPSSLVISDADQHDKMSEGGGYDRGDGKRIPGKQKRDKSESKFVMLAFFIAVLAWACPPSGP